MEQAALDLIPWQQKPQLPEQKTCVIEWNGGTFEIPRLGYLMVNELDQIQAIDPKNALYRLTAETSVEISRATNLEHRQAFALLTKLHARQVGARVELSTTEDDICIEHSKIIGSYLEQALTMTNRVVIRSCTVVLQRIKPEWTDENTQRLPQELISNIYAFQQEEERAQQEQPDPEAAMRDLEEGLGKLAEVSRSNVIDPTGDSFTGTAHGSGPDGSNLGANSLDSSLAPMLSKRSQKGMKRKKLGFTRRS